MRTCEVCDTQAISREPKCRVCETPLPESATLPASEASPRRWSGGVVAFIAALSLAVGFGAGWLSDRFPLSPEPAVSAAPGDAVEPVPVEPGQCLGVAGYELLNISVANLSSHVVDCSEATALTQVIGADGCATYCQTAEDATGQPISFYEIPAVGRCFFAYVAENGRESGWPSRFVPCYAVPDQRIVDHAPDIAAELETDASSLRLVTQIVTLVSQEDPTCADGEDKWQLEYREPTEWICVEEVRAH